MLACKAMTKPISRTTKPTYNVPLSKQLEALQLVEDWLSTAATIKGLGYLVDSLVAVRAARYTLLNVHAVFGS